jgi:hypothetical protein
MVDARMNRVITSCDIFDGVYFLLITKPMHFRSISKKAKKRAII